MLGLFVFHPDYVEKLYAQKIKLALVVIPVSDIISIFSCLLYQSIEVLCPKILDLMSQ